MQSNGSEESHQNNNLKVLTACRVLNETYLSLIFKKAIQLKNVYDDPKRKKEIILRNRHLCTTGILTENDI
jgi:hypothetical protein